MITAGLRQALTAGGGSAPVAGEVEARGPDRRESIYVSEIDQSRRLRL